MRRAENPFGYHFIYAGYHTRLLVSLHIEKKKKKKMSSLKMIFLINYNSEYDINHNINEFYYLSSFFKIVFITCQKIGDIMMLKNGFYVHVRASVPRRYHDVEKRFLCACVCQCALIVM